MKKIPANSLYKHVILFIINQSLILLANLLPPPRK